MRYESPRIRSRPSYTEPPKLTGLWKQGLQQHSIPFERFSLVSPSLRALQPRLSISRSRFILLELLVQESATSAVEIVGKHFPGVECKWGDQGLEEIIADSSILGVAVVLAGQAQVDFSLKLLKAGKNVLQATSELETAVSSYKTNLGYSRKLSI